MPKTLADRLVVVQQQYADQIEIQGYSVDAQTRQITLTIVPSRLNDDGVTRTVLPSHAVTFDDPLVTQTMGLIVSQIVLTVLSQIGAPQQVIDRATTAMNNNLAATADVYYQATRDQLYARL
jgi:hypothetical protein